MKVTLTFDESQRRIIILALNTLMCDYTDNDNDGNERRNPTSDFNKIKEIKQMFRNEVQLNNIVSGSTTSINNELK
jgi:hypothetical protein